MCTLRAGDRPAIVKASQPTELVMAVSGMALYTQPEQPYWSVLMVAAIFSLLNCPSCSTWAIFGTALRGFLADPVRLKWFNIGMGATLAASVALIIK